uniref:Uncharacterized protein n=1 Tax=Rhizophora mucronata TaxID=61149 RepID=A0A2P2JCC8_RHIMU
MQLACINLLQYECQTPNTTKYLILPKSMSTQYCLAWNTCIYQLATLLGRDEKWAKSWTIKRLTPPPEILCNPSKIN